jgi:hypothetical protein
MPATGGAFTSRDRAHLLDEVEQVPAFLPLDRLAEQSCDEPDVAP